MLTINEAWLDVGIVIFPRTRLNYLLSTFYIECVAVHQIFHYLV